MMHVGIDPGYKGAIAVIEGSKVHLLRRTPRKKGATGPYGYDLLEMAKIAEWLANQSPKPFIFLERARAMPGDGIRRASNRSMFNFGMGYGIWVGILASRFLPVYFVEPKEWKKEIIPVMKKIVVGAKERRIQQKKESIAFAKAVYPNVNLKPGKMINDHDGLADALCLATYGLRRTKR